MYRQMLLEKSTDGTKAYGRVAQKPEMHEDGNHRKKEDWPSRAQNMDVDKSEQSHSAIVMDKTG